jgi:hypothetical protein
MGYLKHTTMKIILICNLILLSFSNMYGQDTLRLTKKPNIILKSWYPEFKDFPTLKINEQEILLAIFPDYKNKISNNDINLKPTNADVEIQETEKPNQYLVKVLKAEASYVEFEIWLDLGNETILVKENNVWKNVIEIYPYKENRIMIQTVKLKIAK